MTVAVHPPDNGDWSETPATAPDEETLTRSKHFTVPAGTVIQSAYVSSSTFGILLEAYFNGVKVYTGPGGPGEVDFILDPSLFKVDGVSINVLAMHMAANGNTAPYIAWSLTYVS